MIYDRQPRIVVDHFCTTIVTIILLSMEIIYYKIMEFMTKLAHCTYLYSNKKIIYIYWGKINEFLDLEI